MWWQLLNRGYIWWLTGDEVATKRERDFLPDSVSLSGEGGGQGKKRWWPRGEDGVAKGRRGAGQGEKMWWPMEEDVVTKGGEDVVPKREDVVAKWWLDAGD